LKKILHEGNFIPAQKIGKVCLALVEHSFGQRREPSFLDSKILQDADGFESLGAIAIMRCFSSAGLINKVLYDWSDPFCYYRRPKDLKFGS